MEVKDLPDKNPLDLTSQYAIKLHPTCKRKIDIINGYKNGLTAEIRKAIEDVVDAYWDKLQVQLKENDQAG
jgi:hypothetical protein